jgi:cytochrome c-type biogenesis protein CcmF
MFILSLALFVLGWDDLSSDNELDSLLSRESAFLLANLLFIALAFTVWWGTHFPIISEAVTGEKIVVGPPFFMKTTGPLFAALVLLMGIAPLMPWRRITSRKLLYTLRWPALAGVLVAVGLYFFTWIKLPGALMTFAFLAFTMTTTCHMIKSELFCAGSATMDGREGAWVFEIDNDKNIKAKKLYWNGKDFCIEE